MRGNEFLDKMELIDPAYVEEADNKPKKKKSILVKWGAMAACFCLIAAAAAAVPRFLPGDGPSPAGSNDQPMQAELPIPTDPVESAVDPEDSEGSRSPWTAVFNEPVSVLDAARKYVPGYFTEELDEEELAALGPALRRGDMEYSGFAGFDGSGSLIEVILKITAPHPERTVDLVISQNGRLRCYETDGEPVISACEGVDYTVYQWSPADRRILLEADAEIDRYHYCFTMETTPEQSEKAKEDFQAVLECFSRWDDGKPDLSAIRADSVPEFFDVSLTLPEARADADFGAYMPDAVPSGYAEESVRRYKDQNYNYLSGIWTKGYDRLDWQVSSYTERDENRLTGIDETENYDLSLYPIPRADSVPDELREIVNDPIFIAEELTPDAVYARAYKTGESGDSSGWRMAFSVKYNDIIVRISSKGVDPEWVYRQLIGLPTG